MKIWKWLFLILAAVNVIFIIWIITALNKEYTSPSAGDGNYSTAETGIEVKMDNESVASLINEALDDETLVLSIDTESIRFDSSQQFYGLDIQTSLELEPVSTGEEVVFEVENINVSDLPLTQDMLYSLIRSQSDLPEGIRFKDDERALAIETGALTESLDLDLEVDSIDYSNNEWYFSIHR